MDCFNTALFYASKGKSVIPVLTKGKNKKPLIKWTDLQNRIASEEEINSWWLRYPDAQLGLVTGKFNDIIVIDTDTEESALLVDSMLEEGIEYPIQKTPRGGKHYFFKYEPGFVNRAKVAQDIDIRTDGGMVVIEPSISEKGAWEWVGDPELIFKDPCLIPAALREYINNALIKANTGSKGINSLYLYRDVTSDSDRLLHSVTSSDNKKGYFTEGRRDDDLFSTANVLLKGYMKEDMARQVINMIAEKCDPPFSKKEAQEKIDSAIKHGGKFRGTISGEVREWALVTSGVFSVNNCYNECQLVTKDEKGAARKELERLEKQGLIAKVGDERGKYRKVEEVPEPVRWAESDDTPLMLKWPLRLEQFYECLPRNLVVIAGSPDAGKTCFCLNFAMENMKNHQIRYFTSEMGAKELKSRIKKFPIHTAAEWKNVEFLEVSHNFEDLILPDAINIVDYIEAPEEAWKITTPINKIYKKLKDGMCLIALQKPRNRDVARGGEGTLDRPRLYLSMGNNEIKIVKCKNWVQENVNPNGKSLEYTISTGSEFHVSRDWYEKDWDSGIGEKNVPIAKPSDRGGL